VFDLLTSTAATATVNQVPANYSTAVPAIYSIEVQRVASDWIYIQTNGATANRSWFNLLTVSPGTIGTAHTNVSIVDIGGGILRITLTAGGTVHSLTIAHADGNGILTNTIGHSFLAANATVAQTRCTGFTNLMSSVVWAQATATVQPTFSSTGFNGRPALLFYGGQNIPSTEAAVVAAFAANADATVFYLSNGGSSVDQYGTVLSCANGVAASVSFRSYGYNNTGAGVYKGYIVDDAGAVTSNIESATADAGNHVFEWVGGSGPLTQSLVVDGTANTTAPVTLTPITMTRTAIGGRGNTSNANGALANGGAIRGVWAFAGILSAAARARVRAYAVTYGGL